MLTYQKRGRDLLLTVEGVAEPFAIPPLPTNPGLQMTATYLGIAGGDGAAQDLADALMMAVDGAVRDDEGRFHPRPENERRTYARAGDELTQEEAENLMSAAFFWQTALGLSGVRTFIENGEGTVGSLHALSALNGRIRALSYRNATVGHSAPDALDA